MAPSYPIVFYVSGHGFGHASRSIEVMRGVLRLAPETRIVVKTSAPRRLFERALHGRVEVIDMACDAGMVQIDSLTLSTKDSLQQAKAFQRRVPRLAAGEATFLRARAARVVVGDIPPLAFAAAAAAGVPSIAIGNFTWDWIYEAYPEEAPFDLAREIRDAYRTATLALRLPMSGGFAGLEGITRDIPFVARQSQLGADQVRLALGLPARTASRPLVLISFGGHGLQRLDTETLATLADYTIATTDALIPADRVARSAGLLHFSEHDFDASALTYADLVRAADVVVTKPGYGIISEAIANDTALLYTSRGRFVEYEVLVNEMPRYLRTRFIEQNDLVTGNWGQALELLLSQPPAPERPALNGADIAAREILGLADSRL